jgi:hypothetical protein
MRDIQGGVHMALPTASPEATTHPDIRPFHVMIHQDLVDLRRRIAGTRSWAEQAYPNLIYFNKVDKGNHYAAWQEPDLFTSEVRAAFRSVR